jgi:hypothetical protein
MAQCYNAAACKYECFLQQDPSSSERAHWQQLVRQNKANVKKAEATDASGKLRR